MPGTRPGMTRLVRSPPASGAWEPTGPGVSGRRVHGRHGRRLPLDLGPMHHAALRVVEGIAAMHGAAVVPEQEVADTPGVLVTEFRLRGVVPEVVQQFCRGVGVITFD